MRKSLSEMTIEELQELFPISLSDHQEYWSDWYNEEARRIARLLPVMEPRIQHIGSTAIRSIWAKPIIDILLEIPADASMENVKQSLIENGYIRMSEEDNRKSF